MFLIPCAATHITISFRVVSSDRYSTQLALSLWFLDSSTIFWNIVLFLNPKIKERGLASSPHRTWPHVCSRPCGPSRGGPARREPTGCPLEVECQVRGDDGDVHEVDDMLMLPPVQVLVDVQVLCGGDAVSWWPWLCPLTPGSNCRV